MNEKKPPRRQRPVSLRATSTLAIFWVVVAACALGLTDAALRSSWSVAVHVLPPTALAVWIAWIQTAWSSPISAACLKYRGTASTTFDANSRSWHSLTMARPSSVGAARFPLAPVKWNTDHIEKPLPSIGPYVISSVDNSAKVYVETPNTNWWGEAPKLDKIAFAVID